MSRLRGRLRSRGENPREQEWLAGFQIVEVDSEERALEIAARLSAVPGEGGVPIQQPIQVRQVMEAAPKDAAEMENYLQTAGGER